MVPLWVNDMPFRMRTRSSSRTRPVRRVRRRASSTNPRYSRRLKALIRSTVRRVSEPKSKHVAPEKVELYHNAFYGVSGGAGGMVIHLNNPNAMPTQGTGDNQRVGDQIYMQYYKIKLLIGQKGDRPNVNFRWLVVTVPKGSGIVYGDWFVNTSGNVLLDDPNPDFVKTIKSGYMRPNEAGLTATGDDEYTFTKRLSFTYRKLLKFGPAQAAISHNDNDLYFILMAYDAYGTLQTNNVAYAQMSYELFYRDP